MSYDATYALSQMLHALHSNTAAKYDATTALASVLPQALMPSDGRPAFTLPNAAPAVAPIPTGTPIAPAVAATVTQAVKNLKAEKPKGKG